MKTGGFSLVQAFDCELLGFDGQERCVLVYFAGKELKKWTSDVRHSEAKFVRNLRGEIQRNYRELFGEAFSEVSSEIGE